MEEKYRIVEDTIRHTFTSVVWSHKIQEKQADICSNKFRWMETIRIIAASLTAAGIFSIIFTDQLWLKIVSTCISFVTIFVSAFFKTFNLQKMVSAHKETANQLVGIRDRLTVLLTKVHICDGTPEDIMSEFETILKELDGIYKAAPNTTDKAVAMARKALNVTKDNTFTDEETDAFLPQSLKRNKE